MEKIYKLNIVTPNNKNINEEVESVIISTLDGKLEFLSNYAEAIISLEPSVTRIIKSNKEINYIFTSSGIAHFNNNILRIMCDSLDRLEDIDFDRVEESKQRAIERLKSIDVKIDKERAKKSLDRANARLKLKEIK